MAKRLFLCAGILLGFSALAIAAFVFFWPNWIRHASSDDAIRDDDLAIARPVVADEANGYFALMRAAEALTLTNERAATLRTLLEPGGWDDAQAAQWVEAHPEVIDDFLAAARAPAFVPPPVVEPEDELPNLPAWQRVFQLTSTRARLRARHGEADAAIDDLVAMLDLARKVRLAPAGVLGHGIIGIELQDLAIRTLLGMLPDLALSPSKSHALAQKLARYATDPEDWRRTWAGEYQGMKRVLLESRIPGIGDLDQKIEEAELPEWLLPYIDPAYFFKPKATANRYGEVVRDIQRFADQPCSAMGTFGENVDFSLIDALKPNAIGRVLVAAATTGVRDYELRRCESDTLLAAARIQVALRAWFGTHGRLPDSLDALVPNFLAELPKDAYDDRAFEWSAAERRLRSPGLPASSRADGKQGDRSRAYALAF